LSSIHKALSSISGRKEGRKREREEGRKKENKPNLKTNVYFLYQSHTKLRSWGLAQRKNSYWHTQALVAS
jgi:hypothetical protein